MADSSSDRNSSPNTVISSARGGRQVKTGNSGGVPSLGIVGVHERGAIEDEQGIRRADPHAGRPRGTNAQRSHFTATLRTPMSQASNGSRAAEFVGVLMRTPATPAMVVPCGVIAPNGQASAHILQPMQVCSLRSTELVPNVMAFTGQTRAHGASSQCRHTTGAVAVCVRVTINLG